MGFKKDPPLWTRVLIPALAVEKTHIFVHESPPIAWQWRLIYSFQTQPNLTAIAKAKNLFVSETGRDIFSN